MSEGEIGKLGLTQHMVAGMELFPTGFDHAILDMKSTESRTRKQ